MASIYDWSTTASSNGNSDSAIDFTEGQAPSTVNNSARALMGRGAEFVADLGGALAAGGTANGLTVTANSAFTTLVDGRIVAFRATADNTGAATLNVNSIGAKAIRKMDSTGDVALVAGEIQNTGIYVAQYQSALNGAAGAWLLVNPTLSSAIYALSGLTTVDNTVPRFSGTGGQLQTSSVVIDDSNNVTGIAALTVTGAFTSVGINDDATGERLKLALSTATWGTSSGDFVHVKANADGVLYISGGTSSTSGANLFLAGGSHASLANDWGLRSGASDVLRWDDSAAALTLTGAATFTGSAGSRLVLDRSTAATNSVMSFTTTGSSVHLGHGAASTFAIKMSDNNIANTPLLTLNSSGNLAITGGFSGTTGTFSGAISGTTGTFSGAVSGTTGTFSSTVAGTTVSASTAFRAAAGSAGTPSVSFTGDTNTGLYSYGTDEIGVSVAGAFLGNFTASGINLGRDTQNAAVVGSSIGSDGQCLSSVQDDTCWIVNRIGSDGTIMSIRNDNVTCGTISISGAATAYNESSDGRLKTNLRPIESGAVVDALEPWLFDWKSGGSGCGVIAQEAHEVFPYAITYDEPGDLWMADYSKFVPLLLAEVKALRARVAALEA